VEFVGWGAVRRLFTCCGGSRLSGVFSVVNMKPFKVTAGSILLDPNSTVDTE